MRNYRDFKRLLEAGEPVDAQALIHDLEMQIDQIFKNLQIKLDADLRKQMRSNQGVIKKATNWVKKGWYGTADARGTDESVESRFSSLREDRAVKELLTIVNEGWINDALSAVVGDLAAASASIKKSISDVMVRLGHTTVADPATTNTPPPEPPAAAPVTPEPAANDPATNPAVDPNLPPAVPTTPQRNRRRTAATPPATPPPAEPLTNQPATNPNPVTPPPPARPGRKRRGDPDNNQQTRDEVNTKFQSIVDSIGDTADDSIVTAAKQVIDSEPRDLDKLSMVNFLAMGDANYQKALLKNPSIMRFSKKYSDPERNRIFGELETMINNDPDSVGSLTTPEAFSDFVTKLGLTPRNESVADKARRMVEMFRKGEQIRRNPRVPSNLSVDQKIDFYKNQWK